MTVHNLAVAAFVRMRVARPAFSRMRLRCWGITHGDCCFGCHHPPSQQTGSQNCSGRHLFRTSRETEFPEVRSQTGVWERVKVRLPGFHAGTNCAGGHCRPVLLMTPASWCVMSVFTAHKSCPLSAATVHDLTKNIIRGWCGGLRRDELKPSKSCLPPRCFTLYNPVGVAWSTRGFFSQGCCCNPGLWSSTPAE
jgi:hypothetical protein